MCFCPFFDNSSISVRYHRECIKRFIGIPSYRYDGNNDWLAMNGNPNEWAVGFHGSDQKGTELIAQTRIFKEGKRQHYQYSEDINEKSNNRGKLCGKGIYFGSQIEIAERFSNFKSDNKTCVLQVNQYITCFRILRT